MKIILNKRVESLTGILNRKYGYAIRKQGNAFYGVRLASKKSTGDGHLNFIFACAKLAQQNVYLDDVIVKRAEIIIALTEAQKFNIPLLLKLPVYHARDIINLKITMNL